MYVRRQNNHIYLKKSYCPFKKIPDPIHQPSHAFIILFFPHLFCNHLMLLSIKCFSFTNIMYLCMYTCMPCMYVCMYIVFRINNSLYFVNFVADFVVLPFLLSRIRFALFKRIVKIYVLINTYMGECPCTY